MSTDQQLKPSPHSPQTPTLQPSAPEPPKPKTSALDLSVTKIIGGALAAMTAAALGSRLSVAGTVIGAAIASIIAAVASALYTASLARTQEKVKTVFSGRSAGPDEPTLVQVPSGHDTRVETAPMTQSLPAALDPHWPRPTADIPVTNPARKVSWKGIVVGALAAFAIAAASLTGFELISGHALSGGDGTTITQVGSADTKSTEKPSETPKPTASPSTPSTQPSSSATTESTREPSSTPAPSNPSSVAPTTPAPSSSAVPSASASAQTAAPGGPSAAE